MATTGYPTWYAQPAQDYYGGDYTAICAAFEATATAAGVPPLDPAHLLTNSSTGIDQMGVFVLLSDDDRVHVLHRLYRHSVPLGVPVSPFDGLTFATLDDVTELGPSTVLVPADIFHRTVQLQGVRTAAGIDAALVANPGVAQLAAAVAADPDTGDVRTRLGMYVPPAYAPAILRAASSPTGLTPVRLWTEVVALLRATAGHEVACSSFVDWCRVAVSHGVGPANPLHHVAPTVVAPDARLSKERFGILSRDLPQRFGAPLTDLGPVVNALGIMRTDTNARMDARDAREDAKRAAADLPSTRWRGSLEQVLNVCQVDNEADLPRIWHDMAGAGVKKDRQTIQLHFRAQAATRGLGAERVPICSAELAKDMGNLLFGPLSNDDLLSGLSIFALCYPTQDSARRANELAGYYDSQMDGTTGLTLADTIALKAAQDLKLPSKLLQVKALMQVYELGTAAFLGGDHSLLTSYTRFVTRANTMEAALDSMLDGNVNTCSAFIRWIHLNMCIWFTAQVSSVVAVPPPNFMEILDKIELQSWVPMTLPLAYLKVPVATATALASRSTTTAAVVPTAPVTPRGPPAPVVPGTRSHVKAPKELLDAAIPVRGNFNIKAHIAAHGTPPTNDAGGLMCLSFHARGSCRVECDRGPNSGAGNDHKRHNQEETQRLKAYLDLAGPIAVAGGN